MAVHCPDWVSHSFRVASEEAEKTGAKREMVAQLQSPPLPQHTLTVPSPLAEDNVVDPVCMVLHGTHILRALGGGEGRGEEQREGEGEEGKIGRGREGKGGEGNF